MGKRLPYFQFEPAQYMSGDIVLCSYGAQGVFMHLQAIYWQRECDLTLVKAKRIIKNDELLEELIQEEIIHIDGDHLIIGFLDEQLESITKSKKVLSEAGKKGAEAKRLKAEKEAPLEPPLSEVLTTPQQLDKIKGDEIKGDETIDNTLFEIFWDLYDKKVDRKKCEPKFNKLKQVDKDKIIACLPGYVKSTTDLKQNPVNKYRKDPHTFLNNRSWENELPDTASEVKPVYKF